LPVWRIAISLAFLAAASYLGFTALNREAQHSEMLLGGGAAAVDTAQS
jgi:hypothetical protein